MIETKGEARKRKAHERRALQHAQENVAHNNCRRRKRAAARLARDRWAEDAGLPLHVLEMDENFQKVADEYATIDAHRHCNSARIGREADGML
jgi:hypothetical protein